MPGHEVSIDYEDVRATAGRLRQKNSRTLGRAPTIHALITDDQRNH